VTVREHELSVQRHDQPVDVFLRPPRQIPQLWPRQRALVGDRGHDRLFVRVELPRLGSGD